MNPHVFREYDVRGLVAEDLTPEFTESLGRAFASAVAAEGGRRVAVGMDVRTTSPPLRDALVRGITAAGVDAVVLGQTPTPAVSYSVHHWGLDGAVQITGSHNPLEYNGFKMMLGKSSLYGAAILDLRRRIEEKDFASGQGAVEEMDVLTPYMDELVAGLTLTRPLTVAIDAGNGCASELAPELFRRLGCRVIEVFCTVDGNFPDHIPDPTLPETLHTLRARAAEAGADFAVAFDGDADRLGALDDEGRILWGDQLLALLARRVLAERPGASVLFEVKCSRALEEDIRAHGGVPVMVRTGHSLIKKAMRETGAPLAGEMSGHLFFADSWYGFDDALYAAGRLAQVVASSDRSLARLADDLPRYHATPEIRVDCPDERKFEVVDRVLETYRGRRPVNDVDGARIEFDAGWGLVRASNTQPVLVVRTEGTSEEARDAILDEIAGVLATHGVALTHPA